jgi:hypothetical protein
MDNFGNRFWSTYGRKSTVLVEECADFVWYSTWINEYIFQDSIQKIMLELSVMMWKCHRMSEKRRTLFMYQLFTRLLLQQFHTQLGGAWVYVLRDVILRLVYLIKDITAVPLYVFWACIYYKFLFSFLHYESHECIRILVRSYLAVMSKNEIREKISGQRTLCHYKALCWFSFISSCLLSSSHESTKWSEVNFYCK